MSRRDDGICHCDKPMPNGPESPILKPLRFTLLNPILTYLSQIHYL